jgi:hypothetical protein
VQLRHGSPDQLALSCAGADDWHGRTRRVERPKERESSFAAVLDVVSCAVGEDDHACARGRGDGIGRRDASAEALNRGRLQKVERLAGSHGSRGVYEADLRYAIASGECMRDCASEGTGAEDRDARHQKPDGMEAGGPDEVGRTLAMLIE